MQCKRLIDTSTIDVQTCLTLFSVGTYSGKTNYTMFEVLLMLLDRQINIAKWRTYC